MDVETKAGWIFAVRQLAGAIGQTKPEVELLEPIAAPSEATTEDVANAINDLIAALKA